MASSTLAGSTLHTTKTEMSETPFTPNSSEVELLVLKNIVEPFPNIVILNDIQFYLDDVKDLEDGSYGEYKPELASKGKT